MNFRSSPMARSSQHRTRSDFTAWTKPSLMQPYDQHNPPFMSSLPSSRHARSRPSYQKRPLALTATRHARSDPSFSSCSSNINRSLSTTIEQAAVDRPPVALRSAAIASSGHYSWVVVVVGRLHLEVLRAVAAAEQPLAVDQPEPPLHLRLHALPP